MIEARRLLEERQAAEHAEINANIRAAAGRGIVADAQPDAASEEQPRRYVDANAGAGLTMPPPEVETTADKMNRWLRAQGKSFV